MKTRARITRRWIVFAVLAALGVAVVYGLAVLTPQGQAAENSGLRGADLVFGRATGTAAGALADVTPVSMIGGALLVAAIALIRRRPALARLYLAHERLAIGAGTLVGLLLAWEAFGRSGLVDPTEAYRHAVERDALVALLRRDGLDTSFVERLA